MSNYDADVEFEKPKETPETIMRGVERTLGISIPPWQFELLKKMEGYDNAPYAIPSFFRDSRLIDKKLYFDGGTKRGVLGYSWASQHFQGYLLAAFGEIEVILAHDKRTVKSFHIRRKIERTQEKRERVAEIVRNGRKEMPYAE